MADLKTEPASKRRTEDRDGLKNRVLALIAHWGMISCKKFEIRSTNIPGCMRITSCMHNIIKHKRQAVNNTGSQAFREIYLDQGIQIGEKTFPIRWLEECFDWLLPAYGFQFRKNEEWISILVSCIVTFGLFKCRLEELRIGYTMIPRGRDNNFIDISTYGIYPCHGILLEGIRWDPDKRSAAARACGPLTQMICYFEARNKSLAGINYHSKWEASLKDTLSHFEFLSPLLRILRRVNHSEFSQLLRALADLLLITGSCTHKKVTPPLTALLLLYRESQAQIDQSPLIYDGKTAAVAFAPIQCGLSGRKGVELYHIMANDERTKVQFHNMGDIQGTSEIIFHSTFGSHHDNLGVLKWMTETNANWKRRSDFSQSFENLSAKELIDTTIIKIKWYAKPSSANQSQFFRPTTQQESSISVSAGRDLVNDNLLKYLSESQENVVGSEQTLQGIILTIKSHTQALTRKIREKGEIEWGTTGFVDINAMDSENPLLTYPPQVFNEEFFMATRDEVLD